MIELVRFALEVWILLISFQRFFDHFFEFDHIFCCPDVIWEIVPPSDCFGKKSAQPKRGSLKWVMIRFGFDGSGFMPMIYLTFNNLVPNGGKPISCLLYTSDAADE